MGIWEAIEKLSELVDESDPDVSVSRLTHVAHAVALRALHGKPLPLSARGRITVVDVTRVFPLLPPFGSGF